jgi:hypothetical protein
MIRITSGPRLLMRMFDPTASNTSMLSVLFSSHGLAVNAYGFEVNAPTGHTSITLPDSSLVIRFSTYVPISSLPPRPSTPRSSTPAISFANLTHLQSAPIPYTLSVSDSPIHVTVLGFTYHR